MTIPLVKNRHFFGLCMALVSILGSSAAFADTPPDWAAPLLAEDVSGLGQGYRFVRLADIGLVRYASGQKQRQITRGAIRVLAESGRSAAVCRCTYNANTEKIVSARAWIVSADDKNTQSVGLREFIDFAAKYEGVFWPQQRIVEYSAAENIAVGGAFVWEFETESQVSIFDHTWEFPEEIPTLLNLFEITPAPGGKALWHASNSLVPSPATGGTVGSLRWEERNFRPRGTGDKPDGFLPAPRFVSVRLIGADGATQVNSWNDLAKLTSTLIQPRIDASAAELTTKANALVQGKANRWDRIRALTAFVQKEIVYLSIRLDKDTLAGYRPRAAIDVFGSRFGDCKDKATLLIAMLRAVGDRGYPVLVFSGDPTAILPEWPSPRFNHMIVCLPADDSVPSAWPMIDGGSLGKLVLFDPTDPTTPLGVLPEADQGGHGLVVSPDSAQLIALPTAREGYERNADIVLAANGDLAVKLNETATGNAAVRKYGLRVVQGREKFKRSLVTQLHDAVGSVESFDWNENWNAEKAQWMLNCEFAVHEYGQRSGELLIVDPQLLPPYDRPMPWKTQSEGSVWSPPGFHREKARIVVPANYVVDELPSPWQKHTPHLEAAIRYTQSGREVLYEVEFSEQPGFMDRVGYEARRQLLLEADQMSRRPIVLRHSQGTAAAAMKP